jgi:SSS family solute:Na+ symporter
MIGFALAVPLAVRSMPGGMQTLFTSGAADDGARFWSVGSPGLATLAIIVPPFIVSPGLLQKIFGARDDRAVRLGVGLNAAGLLVFAIVPALLGMVARAQFPSLPASDSALPMLLVHALPPLVGAIGLAAVFSAEISASDAILFMLTTSLSQDFYQRFLNPAAEDRRVLRVAQGTAVGAGALGTLLAIALGNVVNALTIFYTLIGVSLFVPVVAGLYVRRTSSAGALVSMVAGVSAALGLHVSSGGRGIGVLSPALAGLAAATAAWVITLLVAPVTPDRT